MTLKIYNTLSGKKEEFVPMVSGKVNMYVCGPTVYDNCHLGHARASVVFDVIFRYLKFSGYDVNYVRNFTDIDDKIINRANEENIPWKELTEKFIKEFYKDMGAMSVERPTHEPRATEHIQDMHDIIAKLIDKGIAYEAGGDVLFSVRKFPDYGKLSKRNIDDLIAGARVELQDHKKDPLDFVLWKSSKPGEPKWDSPWGEGRPGWHIECSAMCKHFLGKSFDIHGGGKDLIFPHHENEIAQSEAAFDTPMVKYWIHNGFVNVDQEKMSKSLKNFFTIKDILSKYKAETVRLFLLSTHYRSPIDFSDENLTEMNTKLDRFYEMKEKINTILKEENSGTECEKDSELKETIKTLENDFKKSMDDDFNSAGAIGAIFTAIREVNKYITDTNAQAQTLKKINNLFDSIGNTLGIFLTDPEKYFKSKDGLDVGKIEELINNRLKAKENKDWAESDRIRDELLNLGIILQDSKEGTTWKIKDK